MHLPLRSSPISQARAVLELEMHRVGGKPPSTGRYPDFAQSLKEFVVERVNAWPSKVESSSKEML